MKSYLNIIAECFDLVSALLIIVGMHNLVNGAAGGVSLVVSGCLYLLVRAIPQKDYRMCTISVFIMTWCILEGFYLINYKEMV